MNYKDTFDTIITMAKLLDYHTQLSYFDVNNDITSDEEIRVESLEVYNTEKDIFVYWEESKQQFALLFDERTIGEYKESDKLLQAIAQLL